MTPTQPSFWIQPSRPPPTRNKHTKISQEMLIFLLARTRWAFGLAGPLLNAATFSGLSLLYHITKRHNQQDIKFDVIIFI